MRGRRKDLNTFEGQVNNFLRRVHTGYDCWEWLGGRLSNGYGSAKFFGKDWLAHRLSYHLFIGDFDLTLDVCHHCDNKICVKPSHFFLGTHTDNMHDMSVKGRAWDRKGEKCWKAKLNTDIVNQIREEYKGGTGPNELSKKYNVTRGHISNIVARKTWKHI